VAGAIACSAGAASAVTVFDDSGVIQGAGSVNLNNNFVIINLEFNWTETAFTGFLNFTTTEASEIFFVGYNDGGIVATGPLDQISAITVDLLDGVNGLAVSRLNENDASCSTTVAPITGICQFVTSTTAVGGSTGAADRSDMGVPLFGLAPGSYRIGFHEDELPSSGSASFKISTGTTDIPLPASFALILSGLGFLGYASCRKVT
jgi:hypothetical protein